MSEVWKFLTKPILTLPGWVNLICPALLVFAVTGYVGYRVSLLTVYRHLEASSFQSLGKDEGTSLRDTVRLLSVLETDKILMPASESSLQKQVSDLSGIRSRVDQQLVPIVDLQRAADFAMLAGIEQKSGNQSAADNHWRSAQDILRSLGWHDVSEATLTVLADQESHWKVKAAEVK